MVEREMQELLWRDPDRLLRESLQQFAWEAPSPVGRADLVFEDKHGRLLIVEVKRGKLPRGAIDQLLDYFGMMKLKFPEKPVEMMVVANIIPPERQVACENRDIECRAISEKEFHEVAAAVGYTFASESGVSNRAGGAPIISPLRRQSQQQVAGWTFRTAQFTADAQEFLLRCTEEGVAFFSVLFDAQRTASGTTKITWNHQSGFSMQFSLHGAGFVPIIWGFPARNRQGKSIRQRLDFPFDFSIKDGVSEEFIEEFGSALSQVVPFSGGRKRPSIQIIGLEADATGRMIETIFDFAARSAAART